jgi:anaerobic magnesium-protoporphyrin IX monomethyl ester cyclase
LNKWGYFSINVATTRGCPYKCNWCAKPIYGNRYHSRSPEHVVSELNLVKEKFGFDHVWFCDDIFGLKPGWVEKFADLLEEKGLKFKFKIQSRVDLLLKDNTVRNLARAGCETIWVGAESGSQKVLDAMDKGTRVEQIYEATKKIRQYGMKPAFFLQFGYLGETKEDIERTLKMLFDLMPDDIGVSVSYPLPGTKFYEKVKTDLGGKANWVNSDELLLMFKNTYSPEYYKKLHRFIHKKFRRKQSFAALRNIIRNPIKVSGRKIYRAASSVYYVPATLLSTIKLKMTT